MSAGGRKLVSIVVASYNHAEFLPQRMESLLAQTYRPVEIIVVDDGSTDGSPEVLSRWKSNPLVRVVASERNQGVAATSNRGAALASGEYLMFAECDDFNEPTHVERLVQALEASGAAAAFCRSLVVDSRGRVLGDDFGTREPAFRSHCAQDALICSCRMRRFLLRNCVVPNMSAALMRKSAFDEAGGLSSAYRLCADWDLWCRLARRGDFFYVAEPLSSFRTHSTTARSTFAMALQVAEIYALLSACAGSMDLSLADRLKLRVGLARIWGGYAAQGRLAWLRAFPSVWRKTLSHDALSVVFLAIAAAAKLFGARLSLAEGASCSCATS